MNDSIETLAPYRWKVKGLIFYNLDMLIEDLQVFQVLLLEGENTGAETGSLRDARKLVVSDAEFQAFLDRHKHQQSLVPESNSAMKDSYLLLDENLG